MGQLWKIIEKDEEYRAVRARIDQLMDADSGPELDELKLLALLAETYEREHFPIELPDPVSAVKERMEQMGYGQADLARVLGSRSRASELLGGSMKHLSLSQIRALHQAWGIPAEILIRDCA